MNKKIALLCLLTLALCGCGPSKVTGTENASAPSKVSGAGTTLANGLQFWELKTGSGATAGPGKTVIVNYTGWLTDGTKFDSSLDRNQPFSFVLGTGSVIRGWDLGVAGMQMGGKRQLRIPSELAYGPRGMGSIPPNATLIFDVELLDVK
jgi:FKBP-type peptidyl-prolyl cis-trans isomerase